ncbi:MAG: NAD(P)-dependent oxidoreductase, partial [Dehalococcoidia bacterium]|nr:NAD(P)-dependent oxidoreductase [Dehalococcoidia bacterium]
KKFKLADYNARRGKWRSVYSTLLYGKTVGIVGLGRIGSRVARLLAPFGVKLLAFSPHAAPEKAQSLGVKLVDLDTLLKESDFVTLHAVQNAQTRGMIGEARLRLMKPTAYLINTARGGLVNESALAKALKEGWIAGAALDVFEPEVPRPDNPLLDEDFYFKTLYTPHAAGLNPDNEWQLPVVQMENCVTALRGEIPKYVVNPDVIPKWRERIRALDNGR